MIRIFQFFDEENSQGKAEEENHLMNIRIKGMKAAVDYFEESNLTAIPKVELKFDFDRKGLLKVTAEAINNIVLYLKQSTSPTGGTEYIYTPEFVEPIDKEAVEEEIRTLNETGANKTVLNMAKLKKEIGKKRTQNINKELQVEVEYVGVKPLTKEQIEASRKKLDDLDAFDALRIKTMDSRNNLESEIYRRREWLDSNNNKRFVKEEELESVLNLLSEINEWYEEDGYSANLTVLEGKFRSIKRNFTQIDRRETIEKKRNLAIEKFFVELNKTHEEGKKILSRKTWVEDHYNNVFLKEVEVVNDWFNENQEKQNEMTHFDLTDFTSESIESKIYILRRLVNDMNRVQKPKVAVKNSTDDLNELIKNGTLDMEELMKKMNKTFDNFANATSEGEEKKSEEEEKPEL
jgi:hypothetical protein